MSTFPLIKQPDTMTYEGLIGFYNKNIALLSQEEHREESFDKSKYLSKSIVLTEQSKTYTLV